MDKLEDYAKVGVPVVVIALGSDTLATCPDLLLIFFWQVLVPLEVILFVIILVVTFLYQLIVEKDNWGVALVKAFFWALLVAIPFPISLLYAAFYLRKKDKPIQVVNRNVATSTGNNRNKDGVQNIGNFNKSKSNVEKKDEQP